MDLGSFKFPRRARKAVKRVGRGRSSGHGKTCCRGGKGQSARSGWARKWGFEGGQTPLQRRMPKRGFHNHFRVDYTGVNVGDLAGLPAGTRVTLELLKEKGMVRRSTERIKVLALGELGVSLTVVAQAISEAAKAKIEAAGGKVEIV